MSISFPSIVTPSFPQLQQVRAPELPEFARQRVERFHNERVAMSWSGRHILTSGSPLYPTRILPVHVAWRVHEPAMV